MNKIIKIIEELDKRESKIIDRTIFLLLSLLFYICGTIVKLEKIKDKQRPLIYRNTLNEIIPIFLVIIVIAFLIFIYFEKNRAIQKCIFLITKYIVKSTILISLFIYGSCINKIQEKNFINMQEKTMLILVITIAIICCFLIKYELSMLKKIEIDFKYLIGLRYGFFIVTLIILLPFFIKDKEILNYYGTIISATIGAGIVMVGLYYTYSNDKEKDEKHKKRLKVIKSLLYSETDNIEILIKESLILFPLRKLRFKNIKITDYLIDLIEKEIDYEKGIEDENIYKLLSIIKEFNKSSEFFVSNRYNNSENIRKFIKEHKLKEVLKKELEEKKYFSIEIYFMEFLYSDEYNSKDNYHIKQEKVNLEDVLERLIAIINLIEGGFDEKIEASEKLDIIEHLYNMYFMVKEYILLEKTSKKVLEKF